MQLLKRLAQRRVILTTKRVEPREDEWQCNLISGERLCRGVQRGGDSVANTRVAHALQPCCNVANLTSLQLLHWHVLRSEVANFNRDTLRAGTHHRDRFAHLQATLLHADIVHYALIGVVVRIKDERLQRRIKWTARRRDALHQRLKNLWDPLPLFRRGEDHLFTRDRKCLLQLVHHRFRI